MIEMHRRHARLTCTLIKADFGMTEIALYRNRCIIPDPFKMLLHFIMHGIMPASIRLASVLDKWDLRIGVRLSFCPEMVLLNITHIISMTKKQNRRKTIKSTLQSYTWSGAIVLQAQQFTSNSHHFILQTCSHRSRLA